MEGEGEESAKIERAHKRIHRIRGCLVMNINEKSRKWE